MSRQANTYEKIIFEIVKDLSCRFFYESITKVVENEQYTIKIKKDKGEMVGRAFVTLGNGEEIDYEIRYNRITNVLNKYTLVVPGIRAC